MPTPTITIVIFCGRAGSGKSTAAEYLVRHGYLRVSFAGPLKLAVSDVFGIPMDVLANRELRDKELDDWPGWTPRKLLQYVGTDMFRNMFSADIWVRRLAQSIRLFYPNILLWVVDDGRFPNEIATIKKALDPLPVQALSIWIDRPLNPVTSTGFPDHPSEPADRLPCDAVINNLGAHIHLYRSIDITLKHLGAPMRDM